MSPATLWRSRRPLLAALLLPLAGCERFLDKGSNQDMEAAGKKAAAGELREAIALYEASFDGTSKTADAHYRMALLYADKVKSPMDALHHFRRYLALAPTGTHAKEAREYEKEGVRLAIAEMTRGNPTTQDEAVRLRNENMNLQKLISALQMQKNATPPPLPVATGKKGETPQKPIPPGARTHVVRSGETLATIAALYYHNKANYRKIQDANFYPSRTTPILRAGMTLMIP